MKQEMEKASERKLFLVIRKVAIDLFGDIINSTPVDTGRARGSWGINLNRPKPGPKDRKDKEGTKPQQELMIAISEYRPGDKIIITSNLPYIGRLEDGYSNQAPRGMVKKNVSRYKTILQKAALEARHRR